MRQCLAGEPRACPVGELRVSGDEERDFDFPFALIVLATFVVFVRLTALVLAVLVLAALMLVDLVREFFLSDWGCGFEVLMVTGDGRETLDLLPRYK